MRRALAVSLLAIMVGVPIAQAQVVDVISGNYFLNADAYAGVNGDADNKTGSSALDMFSIHAAAGANDNDPILGGASASASATAEWSLSGTVGTSQTLTAYAAGDAYAGDFGLSASANAYSTLDLQFDIVYTTSATATLNSSSPFGTVGSLQMWDGSNWISIATSLDGSWAGTMTSGLYRFYAEDAIGVSGNWSDGFAHDFSLTAMDPVPEPASILALTLGGAALLRKRRK